MVRNEVLKRFEIALNEREGKIFGILPSKRAVERFKHLAIHALRANDALLRCTPTSFLMAVAEAVNANLEIGTGVLGQCYLVPYGDTATLIVGYRGLLDMARRTGELTGFSCDVVRAGDTFTYEGGLDPLCRHIPSTEPGRDKRPWTHVFFAANLRSGAKIVEVMTAEAVRAHRDQFAKGAGRSDSPWKTNEEAMARKTVIRRAFASGKIPLRAEDREVFHKDDYVIEGEYTATDEVGAS